MIFEGESDTVTGTCDAGEESHKVTIDWGDGQTTMVMLDPGDGDFTATHKYRDEDPSGKKQDRHTITATVTNENELSATAMILVKNRPPFFPSLALNPATVPSGGQTTLAGTYTDPGELDSHL